MELKILLFFGRFKHWLFLLLAMLVIFLCMASTLFRYCAGEHFSYLNLYCFTCLNKEFLQIYGAEKLQQALQERPKGKPLLTVCDIIVTTHYSVS